MSVSKFKIYGSSAFALALYASGAQAQSAAFDGCSCITETPVSTAVLGALSSPSGSVAYADLALRNGSTVGTGVDGSVSLITGSCELTLGPLKKAELSLPAGEAGQVCVKVSDLDVAGYEQFASSGAGGVGQGAAIIAGAAAIGGVALAVGSGGSSASR